ncbi:MAG: NAD-dependent epimerase/dehydratase family protein [Oscillochloridaceae bacterium umkhey_bin13]
MTRVLINGIDGRLGARVAELLSDDPDVTLIGLGQATPPAPVGRAELLKARLTGRQLTELFTSEGVESVVHLAFVGAEGPWMGREEAVQRNVLGTMELLGACATAGVQRIVVRSHTVVYGASPLNPTFIRESRAVSRGSLRGVLRDFAEVELFVNEFAARHPSIAISTLRCAPLIGGWSPLVDYLRQPNPRMLTGFDPCFQLLHHEDAARAFAKAAVTPLPGPINIASDDTLCLSQAIRLAGQRPATMLEPMITAALALGNREVLGAWPFDLSFMRHSWVVDTQRARCELGWSPTYSAAECVQMLGQAANGALNEMHDPDEALRSFLNRRKATKND